MRRLRSSAFLDVAMDPTNWLADFTLPGFLGWVFLGNALLRWVLAVLLAIVVLALLLTLRRFLRGRFRRHAERTESEGWALAADMLHGTRFPFFAFVALIIAAQSLALGSRVALWTGRLAILALLIQAALWASTFIAWLTGRLLRQRSQEEPDTVTTVKAAGFLARLLLWSLVFLMAMQNVGIQVGPLLAGLGIGGLAIALAVQNILGDLFAAVSIVLDKPFAVGDFIIVGDFLGSVEYIGLKTTRLRSLSGEQIVFSNSDLLNSRIRNFKRMYERRVIFTLGVQYDTPREKVARISDMIREIIRAQPMARFDRAHFKGFGDSSLDFELVYHVLKPEFNVYMDTQQAINLAIMEAFEAEQIQFAFPTRTLHVQGTLDSRVHTTLVDGSGQQAARATS